MPYLICERCKGYYELLEGESTEDFLGCRCGGELLCIEELEENHEDWKPESSKDKEYSKDEDRDYNAKYRGSIGLNKLVFLILLILIISLVAAISFSKFLPASNNSSNANQSTIGSDYRGYVSKYVYTSSPSETTGKNKVAVVTGIHPRERLSKAVWNDLLRNYHVPEGSEIVHYDINVLDLPNDFNTGRYNGEMLAATYVLPDILKSKYELVIVCHDHQPGYGEGFFITTPKMDEISVKFAETLTTKLTTFNYYKNNGNKEPATSNARFTNQISLNGYRAIVYEMPGLNSYSEAYNMTRELLDASISLL